MKSDTIPVETILAVLDQPGSTQDVRARLYRQSMPREVETVRRRLDRLVKEGLLSSKMERRIVSDPNGGYNRAPQPVRVYSKASR